jgi:hypothetical protein
VLLKRRLSTKAGWASGASRRLGFGSKARRSACRWSSPISAAHLERGARHGREERGGRDDGLGAGRQTGAAVAMADWTRDNSVIDWARRGAGPRPECAR